MSQQTKKGLSPHRTAVTTSFRWERRKPGAFAKGLRVSLRLRAAGTSLTLPAAVFPDPVLPTSRPAGRGGNSGSGGRGPDTSPWAGGGWGRLTRVGTQDALAATRRWAGEGRRSGYATGRCVQRRTRGERSAGREIAGDLGGRVWTLIRPTPGPWAWEGGPGSALPSEGRGAGSRVPAHSPTPAGRRRVPPGARRAPRPPAAPGRGTGGWL